MKATVCVALLFFAAAFADLYLQNPRGSNDRANEANTNADNQQRLFNSQNNAKGGYCSTRGGMMYFYAGSQLTIEWTNQHGCGSPKLMCTLILQYLCSSSDQDPSLQVRDGTTTTTITAATQSDLTYGMHENYAYYAKCAARSGNLGLYMADQYLLGNVPKVHTALRTRSQTTGTVYGFECPEERDYYPYWVPNPWKDIAVLTDDLTRCPYYQAESENVKGRYECDSGDVTTPSTYNNQQDCTQNGQTWTLVPAWNIPAPDCVAAPTSRDNHLGNGVDGYANNYNWTIVSNEACIANNNCQCVFRIRYNMTSVDIPWTADYTGDGSTIYLYNNPTYQQDAANITATAAWKLALNTQQFSRTFQDRSQVFGITARPSSVPAKARIYNLNVKGKRGNIVQTYPATEYDFTPNDLTIRVGDYIHFQWAGCDTNPAGNAGEGTDQTDRSNIVQIANIGSVAPCDEADYKTGGVCSPPLFDTVALRTWFGWLGQSDCPTYEELLQANNNNANNADADVNNCFKLNKSPTADYFDGGLTKMNSTGVFYYMSTRNNNFSNRGQKGILTVAPLLPAWAVAVLITGAACTTAAAGAGAAMFYAKSHPHSFIAEKLASFEK